MANYNLKVHSLVQRLRYKYRDIDACEFLKFHQVGKVINRLDFIYPDYFEVYDSIDKQYDSICLKKKRIRRHFREMLYRYGHLYLVSLTFRDDVFSSTNAVSRLKYVQRWCKSYCLDYYGCIDFGKKNGREHYHVICAIDSPMTLNFFHRKPFYFFDGLSQWDYGFSSCRLIDSSHMRYKSLNYSFKTLSYSFKASNGKCYKPFRSRGIDYSVKWFYVYREHLFLPLDNDECLFSVGCS